MGTKKLASCLGRTVEPECWVNLEPAILLRQGLGASSASPHCILMVDKLRSDRGVFIGNKSNPVGLELRGELVTNGVTFF